MESPPQDFSGLNAVAYIVGRLSLYRHDYRAWRAGALYCYGASGNVQPMNIHLVYYRLSHAYPPEKGTACALHRRRWRPANVQGSVCL